MAKTSKQTRFMRALDHYRQLIGNRPWTADEVAEWLERNGLSSVPGVRDSPESGDMWDVKFEAAKAQGDK